MVKCPNCGHENVVGSNFCANCGERLSPLESDRVGDTTTSFPAVTDDSSHLHETDSEDMDAVRRLPIGHALLVVQRGPGAGSRFLINTPEVSVGRNPDSDIFLDDITVSRHHAKFLLSDGEVIVEDQGSLNGTYINRTLVDGAARLRQGDEVQIGKYRMVFFVSEPGMS